MMKGKAKTFFEEVMDDYKDKNGENLLPEIGDEIKLMDDSEGEEEGVECDCPKHDDSVAHTEEEDIEVEISGEDENDDVMESIRARVKKRIKNRKILEALKKRKAMRSKLRSKEAGKARESFPEDSKRELGDHIKNDVDLEVIKRSIRKAVRKREANHSLDKNTLDYAVLEAKLKRVKMRRDGSTNSIVRKGANGAFRLRVGSQLVEGKLRFRTNGTVASYTVK